MALLHQRSVLADRTKTACEWDGGVRPLTRRRGDGLAVVVEAFIENAQAASDRLRGAVRAVDV
jgi:hypothetical protein